MRPNGAVPSQEFLNRLAKAYDLMKYDVALLGQEEADVFEEAGAKPDTTRKTARQATITKVTIDGGKTIAFLRFPSMRSGDDMPSDKLMNRISAMIREVKNSSDLIIGLSDWGWVGEREYLANNPDSIPDVLFGSGLGSGVDGRVEADGRCVWIRPYDKGRTISELQVIKWPERSKGYVWKEPDNFMVLSTGLGDKYSDHPDVSALLDQ